MAKLTKSTVFPTSAPRRETPMEKTTRAVNEILEGEAEERQIKTARLRKARLDSEADTPAKTVPTTTKTARKRPLAKAVKKG